MLYPYTQTVSILAGNALSSGADLGDRQLLGLVMPSAWSAASLTFQVSNDGNVFYDLHFGAGELTITAAQGATSNSAVTLPPDSFLPWRYVRVRSGTSSAPVNQTADRTIILVSR